MTESRLVLPDSLREELKGPMGPVYTDAERLVADAEERASNAEERVLDADATLVAVGDIVTYHLLSAGHRPDVALVDDRTERSAVEPEVSDAITGFDRRIEVENPPGTLTLALVEAIVDAVGASGANDETTGGASTLIVVDGEEDLGALAAILAVPDGGSVVYGQPGEGMVLVDPGAVEAAVRDLLTRMDGDSEVALDALDAVDHS